MRNIHCMIYYVYNILQLFFVWRSVILQKKNKKMVVYLNLSKKVIRASTFSSLLGKTWICLWIKFVVFRFFLFKKKTWFVQNHKTFPISNVFPEREKMYDFFRCFHLELSGLRQKLLCATRGILCSVPYINVIRSFFFQFSKKTAVNCY